MSAGQFGLCCCGQGTKELQVTGCLPNIGQQPYATVEGVPANADEITPGFDPAVRYKGLRIERYVAGGGGNVLISTGTVEFNTYSRIYTVVDPDVAAFRTSFATRAEEVREECRLNGWTYNAEFGTRTRGLDSETRMWSYRIVKQLFPLIEELRLIAQEDVRADEETGFEALTAELGAALAAVDWTTVPAGTRGLLFWHLERQRLEPQIYLRIGDPGTALSWRHRAGIDTTFTVPPDPVTQVEPPALPFDRVGMFYFGFFGSGVSGESEPGITGCVDILRSLANLATPFCVVDYNQVPDYGPAIYLTLGDYRFGYQIGLGTDVAFAGVLFPIIDDLVERSHYELAGGFDYVLNDPDFWGERWLLSHGRSGNPCA